MDRIKVGVTIGDINGIGPEVIIKTFLDDRILRFCTPIIYGASKVISYHKNIVNDDFRFNQLKSGERPIEGKVNVANCWQEAVTINLGKASKEGGIYAIKALERAIQDMKEGYIDALVTAPINKYSMQLADFPYKGHTEYLTDSFGVKESLMLMVQDHLRVGVATNHIPVEAIPSAIDRSILVQKIKIMHESLIKDFGLEKPKIAILGLNPHAGDGGVIGEEEIQILQPVIEELKDEGLLVMGPFAADGFFGSGAYTKFDGIMAMYHDQGLVPFKLLAFGKGTNFTAGLPVVRTSPDHGTGFDLAGKNEADSASFRQALFTAIDLAKNRKRYQEDHANPLARKNIYDNGEDEILTDSDE
jgi:4-hydroxythreonine-4-phosphate dehydrogenase